MPATRAVVAAGLRDARDLLPRAVTGYQRILARELIRDWERFIAGLESHASNQGPRGYSSAGYAAISEDLLDTLAHLTRRITSSEATRARARARTRTRTRTRRRPAK